MCKIFSEFPFLILDTHFGTKISGSLYLAFCDAMGGVNFVR